MRTDGRHGTSHSRWRSLAGSAVLVLLALYSMFRGFYIGPILLIVFVISLRVLTEWQRRKRRER